MNLTDNGDSSISNRSLSIRTKASSSDHERRLMELSSGILSHISHVQNYLFTEGDLK